MEYGILIHEAIFSNILSEKAKALVKPLFPQSLPCSSRHDEDLAMPCAKSLGNPPSLPAEIDGRSR
jgi:hypothetical protein